MVVGCVVPIYMKINWLLLISKLRSEIKARTPGRAALSVSEGFLFSQSICNYLDNDGEENPDGNLRESVALFC